MRDILRVTELTPVLISPGVCHMTIDFLKYSSAKCFNVYWSLNKDATINKKKILALLYKGKYWYLLKPCDWYEGLV